MDCYYGFIDDRRPNSEYVLYFSQAIAAGGNDHRAQQLLAVFRAPRDQILGTVAVYFRSLADGRRSWKEKQAEKNKIKNRRGERKKTFLVPARGHNIH